MASANRESGVTTAQELTWVAAGVFALYAVSLVSPRVSGMILAALVIGALIILGPQLAKIGK